MLINFEFENFKSYKSNTEFSMLAGKGLRRLPENTLQFNKTTSNESLKLLKNSILFGANGSGKSNFIEALRFLKVLLSRPTKKSTDRVLKSSFLLDDYSMKKPSSFTIEFLINKIQYRYSLKYSDTEILEEKFEYYNKGKYIVHFERLFNEFIKVPNELVEESKKTRNNVLFAYVAQDKNDKHAINLYRWFFIKLQFVDGHLEYDEISNLEEAINNPKKKKEFIKFLNLCDINIIDIEITHEKVPKEVVSVFSQFIDIITNENEFDIDFDEVKRERPKLHLIYKKINEDSNNVGHQIIKYEDESEGTKKIIKLVLYLLINSTKGNVLFLDEFDDSLHLNLSKLMISLFNKTNKNSQFIVTSHQLLLMDTDLRKDQIYFAEKLFDGSSELYSIFDFVDENHGKRSDITMFKRYMQGVYGAIPNVTFEALDSLIEKGDQ